MAQKRVQSPATLAFKRLRAEWKAAHGAWFAATQDAGHVAGSDQWVAREAAWDALQDATDAVAGINDPKARLAALMACPNASVREAARLASARQEVA